MQKRVCIIDFSGTQIGVRILIDDQFEPIDLNLPWEVGFRQETDGILVACFGETLDRLNPNHPAEVRFTALDVHLKEITDVKTLECLFDAFLEEIFHRRLPEHGHPIEAMPVYVITPHQWKPVHRQQLRSVIKKNQSDSPVVGLTSSKLTFRGMLSQVLCLAACYQKAWMDILTKANEFHLFLIDFTRNDIIVYQMFCKQTEDSVTLELCDILRFPDYFMDIDNQISDVQKTLQMGKKNVPVAVAFSGRIDDDAKTIIDWLQAHCSATFLRLQEIATLSGGTELIHQFEETNLAKPLHFVYHFRFGVRLPDGEWVELVPKTWAPPYHRKKAFRVTGVLEEFDIHLYCGLSLSDNSSVHHLATLGIDYPKDSNFSSRNPMEFILSVTLNDSSHGTFTVHFPNPDEQKSVEFTVPALMD